MRNPINDAKKRKSPNNLDRLLTLTSRSAREVLCAAVSGDMTERDLQNLYIALFIVRDTIPCTFVLIEKSSKIKHCSIIRLKIRWYECARHGVAYC